MDAEPCPDARGGCPLERAFVDRLRVVNGPTGSAAATNGIELHKGAREVAWAPGGLLFASASRNGTCRLWDIRNPYKKQPLLRGHSASVTGIRWTGEDEVVTASLDGTLRFWQASNGRTLGVHTGHGGGVMALTGAPGGLLATGGEEGTVLFWDPRSGDPVRNFVLGRGPVVAVEVAADGKHFAAVCGRDKKKMVQVWHLDSGRPIHSFEPSGSLGREDVSISWSPDGRYLALTEVDSCTEHIRICDVHSGFFGRSVRSVRLQQRDFGGRHGDVPKATTHVEWSPVGGFLAACLFGIVHIWDANSRTVRQTLLPENDNSYWARWSADGRHLMTGASDTTGDEFGAQIWTVATGTVRRKINWPVTTAAWSAMGHKVATCSYGGFVWWADLG